MIDVASDRSPTLAYAPVGAAARVPPLWAQPLVLVVLFVSAGLVLLLASLGLAAVAALTDQPLSASSPRPWWEGLTQMLLLFGALAVATLAWVRHVERRPLASAGLVGFRLADLGWAAVGAAWSVMLAVTLVAVTGAEMGPDTASRSTPWPAVIAVIIGCLAVVALLATTEEIVFRGWALSAVASRLGPGWALGLTSVVFGAAHVFPWEWADPARLISFLGFAGMGVAFGAVALQRGSLWSAAAFHTGYNAALVLTGAWEADFQPARMWETLTEGGSGFDSLTPAVVLAGSQGALAAAAVLWWRRNLRRA